MLKIIVLAIHTIHTTFFLSLLLSIVKDAQTFGLAKIVIKQETNGICDDITVEDRNDSLYSTGSYGSTICQIVSLILRHVQRSRKVRTR
jgi:hypothetical protein